MARTLPRIPAGAEDSPAIPTPSRPRAHTLAPLLVGTRALIPLPMDFSTALRFVQREKEDYETEPGRAPGPRRRGRLRARVPTRCPGGPCQLRGPGQRLCAWPSLPRPVTRQSPPLLAKREVAKFAHFAHSFRISFFFFLGGACNFQLTNCPLQQGHPPSPENASCRLWPLLCTPACSRRCWG